MVAAAGLHRQPDAAQPAAHAPSDRLADRRLHLGHPAGRPGPPRRGVRRAGRPAPGAAAARSGAPGVQRRTGDARALPPRGRRPGREHARGLHRDDPERRRRRGPVRRDGLLRRPGPPDQPDPAGLAGPPGDRGARRPRLQLGRRRGVVPRRAAGRHVRRVRPGAGAPRRRARRLGRRRARRAAAVAGRGAPPRQRHRRRHPGRDALRAGRGARPADPGRRRGDHRTRRVQLPRGARRGAPPGPGAARARRRAEHPGRRGAGEGLRAGRRRPRGGRLRRRLPADRPRLAAGPPRPVAGAGQGPARGHRPAPGRGVAAAGRDPHGHPGRRRGPAGRPGAARRRPRPRGPGVRHLHLRLDRAAQGRDDRPPGRGQHRAGRQLPLLGGPRRPRPGAVRAQLRPLGLRRVRHPGGRRRRRPPLADPPHRPRALDGPGAPAPRHGVELGARPDAGLDGEHAGRGRLRAAPGAAQRRLDPGRPAGRDPGRPPRRAGGQPRRRHRGVHLVRAPPDRRGARRLDPDPVRQAARQPEPARAPPGLRALSGVDAGRDPDRRHRCRQGLLGGSAAHRRAVRHPPGDR